MNKLEQLEKRHAEERAKLEAEERIRALLPIKQDEATIHNFKRGPWVCYKAEHIQDAIGILKAFDCVPFAVIKGTFLQIKPREWFEEKDIENAKAETQCNEGGVIEIDGGKNYGPTAKLKRWARLEDGTLVELHVELGAYPCGKGFPPKWHVRSDLEFDRWGHCIVAKHTPPNIPGDLPMIRWGAGSPESYRYSWVYCDEGTFISELEIASPDPVEGTAVQS